MLQLEAYFGGDTEGMVQIAEALTRHALGHEEQSHDSSGGGYLSGAHEIPYAAGLFRRI